MVRLYYYNLTLTNIFKMREIIINTEGTGLHPERDDRITEIVCIELVDKKMTGNMFHTFINPNMKVQDKSDKFNEFLKDKPNFKDIVANFLDFIGNSRLIGHNIKMDLDFINKELGILGLNELQNDTICTLEIARQNFPHRTNNIKILTERLKIKSYCDFDDILILRTELLAEIYLKLTNSSTNFNC